MNDPNKVEVDQETEELNRFRQGNADAFEALVLRYREPAVHFARQILKDYYIAEDLAQECFAYLYLHPDKYDFRASFKTYLFTLIHNKSVDYLRKNRRITLTNELDEGRSTIDHNSLYSRQDPEQSLISREAKQELYSQLKLLKKEYRMAVYLVDLEGLHYSEAAAIMSRNTMGFKVLLHRARKQLRRLYDKEEWNSGTDSPGASISR